MVSFPRLSVKGPPILSFLVAERATDIGTVPAQAKWLSDKEKAFLQARLPANAPRSSEADFKLSEIVLALKDRRLWLFTLVFATKTVGSSGLSFYLPTIVADLGFA